jgi:hypothetical protein
MNFTGFRLNTLGPISVGTGLNPSRDVYKTKADVANLTKRAVADGATLIQQQGDVRLDRTTTLPFGNKGIHNSYCWTFVVEDSGDLVGPLSREQHGAPASATAMSS